MLREQLSIYLLLALCPVSVSLQCNEANFLIPNGIKAYISRIKARVIFMETVKVKKSLHVNESIKTHHLAVKDSVDLGCDISVGCNINMNHSTGGTIGNVLKDGDRFIHDTGSANTFVGYYAGSFDVTGMGNSGFGTDSLLNISTGMGNVGCGFSTLVANTDGSGNSAVGHNALGSNEIGNLNTAVGSFALAENISGSGNIALGNNAGANLTLGDNNMYLANNGLFSESGAIRIGTPGTHIKSFMSGVYGVTVGGAGLAVYVDDNGQLGTVVSSSRFKKNISDMTDESKAIYTLHPVTFEYITDEGQTKQFGLIAEEVAETFPELVIFDKEGQPYAVRYQLLPVLLLNELQQQYALIQELSERLAAVEARP